MIRIYFSAVLAIFAVAVSVSADPPTTAVRGSALRWKNTSIKIALSSSLSGQNPNIKTGTDVRAVVRRSLDTWERVSGIDFIETTSDKQSVSPAGASGDGTNLITIAQTPDNLALFQSDWQTSSARTRAFFNGRNEITEADIVLNPYGQFSDDGTFGTFDLESAITHELGHLLGLTHSFSAGSVMYPNFGRNGTFGLQSIHGRTLSAEDISALAGIYGPPAGGDSCCGQVYGRITLPGGKPAPDMQVWAEDAASGMVLGCAVTGSSGRYRIEGLTAGHIRILAQSSGVKRLTSAFEAGRLEIEKGKTIQLNAVAESRTSSIDIQYLGINSQLADLPVPVSLGRQYLVYLAGPGMESARTTVSTSSSLVTIDPASAEDFDLNGRLSTIRAELKIDPETPPGNYSIIVRSNGILRYVIGGIAVGTYVDNWDFSPSFTR